MNDLAIAGAPVSFGVFELTNPAAMASLPGPDRICEVLQEAGYTGIDLGPVGFLGHGRDLEARLRRFGLGLAGGWVDLPFSDDDLFRNSFHVLEAALDEFTAGAAAPSRFPPKPTLADSGDSTRKANPGGGAGLSLTGDRLQRFAANVQVAADRIRTAGFEPTFHHHMGTYIETPEEIDGFLDATDVDLTFDTGHLLLGGGDPTTGWKRWSSRINHLHLKDVDLDILHAVQQRGGDMVDVWASRAFVPIGEGDLAVGDIVAAALADGYTGWVVIEQDVLPSASVVIRTMERDQSVNFARLSALIDQ